MTRVTGVGWLAHSICASAKRRCWIRFERPRMNSPTRMVIAVEVGDALEKDRPREHAAEQDEPHERAALLHVVDHVLLIRGDGTAWQGCCAVGGPGPCSLLQRNFPFGHSIRCNCAGIFL